MTRSFPAILTLDQAGREERSINYLVVEAIIQYLDREEKEA